jgi:bacteriocin-like protein
MKNLNDLAIEYQELTDDQLETVVGGTFKLGGGCAPAPTYCAPVAPCSNYGHR